MATKIALVTGASSGIGEATARTLQQQGFQVYAAARRVERMSELTAVGIRLLKMDLTDDASIRAGVDRIITESGRLDVLVNNAGYGSYGALEDVPLSEGKYQFEVNLFGLARLTQLVLPHMRANNSGRVINVSSMGGKLGEPLGVWYHATKYAVEGLSDSLRPELAPHGIQVVVIEPGAIKTEWSGIAVDGLLTSSGDTAYAAQAKAHAAMFTSPTLAKRASDPQVIADVIAKAALSRRPKIRYAAGFGAKPALFFRKVLSDRAFDRFLRLTFSQAH